MKLAKIITLIAVFGTISLFATGLSGVHTLVDKINTTKDVKEKSVLMEKLKTELSLMNQDDFSKAQEIVNKELDISKK